MEELLQRALRQAPQWVWRILTLCTLFGLALKYLSDLFRPFIDRSLANVIDPSNLNVTTLAFASLCVVGPASFAAYRLDPNRPRAQAVLSQIDMIEAAMERAALKEQERVTVRRAIIKALADAAKQNIGEPTAVDLPAAVNREIQGLIG